MKTREKCEDKIDRELKNTLEEIREVITSYEDNGKIVSKDGYEYEDLFEWLNSYFLAWNGYKLELSWGGPADGFLLSRDSDNNLVDIRYYYQDWFDGAERRITGQDFDLIEKLYEYCLRG